MPPSVPFRTSPTTDQARETTKQQETKRAPPKGQDGIGDNIITTANHRTNETHNSAEDHVTSTTALNANTSASVSIPGNQLGMYGGGATSGMAYGGMNSIMFGGAGMMGSPYGMMGGGPLSGLNQMLFSVQSVIFSLGQAVQIVGMNTQALHQLLDSATSMFDHALSTFQEMRALDARSLQDESPKDQTKRRRLKALRWALIMSIAYGGYRILRRLLRKRLHQRKLTMYPASTQQQQQQQPYSSSGYSSPSIQPPQQHYGGGSPYYGSSPYAMSNPYSSNYYGAGGASSMYPGGGYGGYF